MDILQSGEERKTINRLVSELEPVIVEDQTSAVNENGNNVDIDGQSVEMARTVLAYQTVTRLIADEISREKYAINEGDDKDGVFKLFKYRRVGALRA